MRVLNEPAPKSSPRASRFERSEFPPSFEITERDIDFLEAIGRHEVAQSSHLDLLFPDASPDNLRRRLYAFFHAGLIARPEAQLSYPLTHRGSRAMAYLLTEAGAALVAEARGIHFTLKPDDLKLGQLSHTLEVTDFMTATEAACNQSTFLALETSPEILERAPHQTRMIIMDSQEEMIPLVSRIEAIKDRLILIDASDVEFPLALNIFDLGQTGNLSSVEQERRLNTALGGRRLYARQLARFRSDE